MLAIALLVLGFFSRFIIHFDNFTPVIAVALFSGVYLNNKKLALILPLALLMMTDIFLGFHVTIFFTWSSVVLIALAGLYLRERKNAGNIALFSVASAVFFFITTNFGVWLLAGFYPKTVAGLMECYVAAIPFFRNTLLSTVIYTIVLSGSYEWLASRSKSAQTISS